MKTLDQRHWLHAGVSIVDFEQVNAGWVGASANQGLYLFQYVHGFQKQWPHIAICHTDTFLVDLAPGKTNHAT